VESLTEPYLITVTITNTCGTAERTVAYAPHFPSLCEGECSNSYDSANPTNVITRFSGIDWDIVVTGCLTKITRVYRGIETELITDVSIYLPLLAAPLVCVPPSENTFDLANEPVPLEKIEENLDAHLNTTATASTVKNGKVDFFYTLSPSHVDRIVLTGDTLFQERVGEIKAGKMMEEILPWISAGGNFWNATIPVNRVADTIRRSLGSGGLALYRSFEIYANSTTFLTEQQSVTVEVKTFLERVLLEQYEKITAGMSGELRYTSTQSKRVCRIDLVYDANARARCGESKQFDFLIMYVCNATKISKRIRKVWSLSPPSSMLWAPPRR